LIDVLIVKSNSVVYHPRVLKILRSLSKKYSIISLGWNREGVSSNIINNFFVTLKLFNLRAQFGKKSIILQFPLFWFWIFINLVKYRPKVVHSCDLDTIIPCYIYKVIFRKKLVFDVFDRLAMSRISPKNKKLYSLVNQIEEFYAKKSDALITTSPKFLESFKNKPKICELILNCAENNQITKSSHRTNESLTLAYTGHVMKRRGVDHVVTAIKDLKGVELVIAGRVLDKDLLEKILKVPNVSYKGLLLTSEALSLEANSDVIVSVYDLSIPNYNVAYSVKNFDAMMLGLPVITNISEELIDEVDFGIKVDYNNLNQIRSAVIRLRDDIQLRKKLGSNARKGFEEKYNWKNMEKKLYKIYEIFFNDFRR